MCPMRFFLVFFSAALAGYFAWKSVRSSPSISDGNSSPESESPGRKWKDLGSRKVIGDAFWVFVDMASGRYLWRAMKGM